MRGQEPRNEWFEFGLNPQKCVLNFLAFFVFLQLLHFNLKRDHAYAGHVCSSLCAVVQLWMHMQIKKKSEHPLLWDWEK